VNKCIQILFGTFLFTFPFSIRFLVYEEAAYRFGNFNPWVSGFIYLPEVLLIITFVLFGISSGRWFMTRERPEVKKTKSQSKTIQFLKFRFFVSRGKATVHKVLWRLFVANAFLVFLYWGDWTLGALWLLRIAEMLMLYELVVSNVLPKAKMLHLLLWGALFQILLGLLQVKLNHSIGLAWLGESIVGSEVLNVAKVNLEEGVKQIRPYGTFLHPNVLAAYLLVVLFLLLENTKKSRWLWLLIFGSALYFTGSLAVWLVGGFAFALWILTAKLPHNHRRWVAGTLMLVLTLVNTWFFFNSHRIEVRDASFRERLDQNVMSYEMIFEHPLGVGVRQFTLAMETVAPIKLSPWEFQPVHNAYFLMLNETGVQGLLLFGLMIFWFFARAWQAGTAMPLFILLFLAPFDHFLWDSWVGMMLIAIAFGFAKNHVRPTS
jgi:hypothetical protein